MGCYDPNCVSPTCPLREWADALDPATAHGRPRQDFAAADKSRVMRSHLVEFVAPGICGTADSMRAAAAWLDEHPSPAVLGIFCDYRCEDDESVLTLVVQSFQDEALEALAHEGRAR